MVLGLLVAWTAYGLGHLPDSTPHVITGWALIGSGLAGWVRAPWSRVGPLLVGAGFLWFVGDLDACLSIEPLSHRCVDPGVGRPVAAALSWLWLGVVIHAAASLPDGRPRGGIRRAIVVAGYVIAMAIPAVRAAPAIPSLLLALAVSVAAIGVLLALLAADARRAALTPDRAVGLGGALAQALRDPDLRVAFHDPARGRWLDPAARPTAPPVPLPGQVETRIEQDGVAVATVIHDPATLADPAVRAAVELAIGLAAHHARLRGDLDAQRAELDASRHRLVTASLRERQALGFTVHQEVERPLAALASSLAPLQAAPGTGEHVTEARAELERSRVEVHDLALGLAPTHLVADGIPGALTDLSSRSPNPVTLLTAGGPRPDPAVEAAVAFVVAESLANAARHAPGAAIRIEATSSAAAVHVVIEDDGPGGADEQSGTGLRGLRDRVEALGGQLVVSSPQGAGTRLAVTIPAHREALPIT